MRVHLLDGTYELFRHHYGRPARQARSGREVAATLGVLDTVLSMLEGGATHLAVATDHVIESFRNDLWPGYKDGSGVDPVLSGQFGLLEEALRAMGVAVFAMLEMEADDALASSAAVLAADAAVEQVVLCTPDKDLAQCVRGTRVVQLDRRSGEMLDEDGVVARYGVGPSSIPDWLALVGDSADGFPGLPGWGRQSASRVLAVYQHLAGIPDEISAWEPALRKAVRGAGGLAAALAAGRESAELFLLLATLCTDAGVVARADELTWRGPLPEFAPLCDELGSPRLARRAEELSEAASAPPR